MDEFVLRDELLIALRSARPEAGAGWSSSDGPAAVEMLVSLLAVDRTVVNGAAAGIERLASSDRNGKPLAGRVEWGSARSRTVALVIGVAAVGMVAAAGLAIVPGQSPARHQSTGVGQHPVKAATWRLAGYISQPSWTVQSSTGPGSSNPDTLDLVCPTATTCYVIDTVSAPSSSGPDASTQTVVEVSNDGGSTWQQSLVPTNGESVAAISCSSSSTCMVTGSSSTGIGTSIFTTADGGRTWTTSPLAVPPSQGFATSPFSCWNQSSCVELEEGPGPGGLGIGYVSYSTTNGGQSWSKSNVPGTFRPSALDCLSNGSCLAVGYAPSAYQVTDPATQMINDSAVIYSGDGGATWSAGVVPAGGDGIIGEGIIELSCSDSLHCDAIENTTNTPDTGPPVGGTRVLITADGGRTWSAAPSISSSPGDHLVCATTEDCWLWALTIRDTGAAPSSPEVVYATSDGGQTWSAEQLPLVDGTPVGPVWSMSCPSVNECMALAGAPSSSPLLGGQLVVLEEGAASESASGS